MIDIRFLKLPAHIHGEQPVNLFSINGFHFNIGIDKQTCHNQKDNRCQQMLKNCQSDSFYPCLPFILFFRIPLFGFFSFHFLHFPLYSFSHLYPTPQTTFRYLGSLGLISIFSLICLMCTATVLSAPIASSFQIFS